MKRDKDCIYCSKNQVMHDLMIEICELNVSTLFLFKEQTYRGRCLVAYNDHINELFELSDEDRNAFMKDVAEVARAMSKALGAEKINYGAYSDKLKHLHFHLVPKFINGPDFGGTFLMNPKEVYLTDDEYTDIIKKIRSEL
jgi:diadenosine tetraphosphate (Ap4A) HIT family hydrolase